MKKYLLFTVLTALTIVSCSKNDVIEDTSDNNVIKFNTYVGNAPETKAVDQTYGTITAADAGFYISAFHTKTTDWDSYAEANKYSPDFTEDNLTKYSSGSGWSATTSLYWPASNDSKITFIAYAPNTIQWPEASSKGVISYTINTDATKQEDIIHSIVENATYNNSTTQGGVAGAVKFQFKHLLSKVGVSVKTDKDYSTSHTGFKINITEVTLGGESNSFATVANVNLYSGEATNAGENTLKFTYTGTWELSGDNLKSETNMVTVNTEENDLIVAPQVFTALPISVKYAVTDDYGTTSAVYTKTGTVATTLVKGTAYNIVINIPLDAKRPITFTVDENNGVAGWGTPTNTPNNGATIQ